MSNCKYSINERKNMKKILLLLTTLLFTIGVHAQKDVVSVADAIKIFQAKTLQVGKQVLEKQGYSYKGVSSDEFGKDYNWVKNMNLTSDFLPTAMKRGNSSMVLLAQDGKTVYIYVFNRMAFAGLQTQVKALGYDMGKAVKGDKSTLICTKDNQPTISFLTLQQPLPYCVQITE
ncbi:hypothetical protein HMPREF9148_02898 [Prevotella sp. F0091]|nr:hypothetical protein HMPREF9148_02898 [Prevotella sp. F0091]